MHPRDDPAGGDRRHFRRLEDSHNANALRRIETLERIVIKHEGWFTELGVGAMSERQRQALPDTLDRTIRWSRLDRNLMAGLVLVAPIVTVIVERILANWH